LGGARGGGDLGGSRYVQLHIKLVLQHLNAVELLFFLWFVY